MADDIKPRSTAYHAPIPTPVAAGVAAAINTAQATTAVPRTASEDSRARAAARAEQLRKHWGSDDYDLPQGKFDFDPRIVPDGWSYQWKRFTVLGQEDPAYQTRLAQGGWQPVPASRHPELMPQGYEGETIDRDGQRLFERPLEITLAAERRDQKAARDQLRQKEDQVTGMPAGANSPFANNNRGKPINQISKDYEPVAVPK